MHTDNMQDRYVLLEFWFLVDTSNNCNAGVIMAFFKQLRMEMTLALIILIWLSFEKWTEYTTFLSKIAVCWDSLRNGRAVSLPYMCLKLLMNFIFSDGHIVYIYVGFCTCTLPYVWLQQQSYGNAKVNNWNDWQVCLLTC